MPSITLSSNGRMALIAVAVLVLLFILPRFLYSSPGAAASPSLHNDQDLPVKHAPPIPTLPPRPDYLEDEYYYQDENLEPKLDLPPPPPKSGFVYNPAIHAKHYGLSEDECAAAFPGLYYEIDRADKYTQQQGNLTLLDIDRSAEGLDLIRVLIYNRQIYIVYENTGVQRNRAASILSTINRALVAAPIAAHIPNIEFTLSVADMPNRLHQWALTRDMDNPDDQATWVMTDQVWWSWPVPLLGEYSTVRAEIAVTELPFAEKHPQLLWRGVVGMGPTRAKLVEAVRDKPWANVSEIHWEGRGGMNGGSAEALAAWDQCNFQFLAYTEGVSYSGRFKYLQSCNSVVVMHKLRWAEYHSSLFVTDGPQQNIVQVERDYSDLEAKMTDLLEHPDKAERIAENSAKVFRDRYLTAAAQACYARKMISSWATHLAFEPTLWMEKVDADGRVRHVLRGKPYETWMIEPMV